MGKKLIVKYSLVACKIPIAMYIMVVGNIKVVKYSKVLGKARVFSRHAQRICR